MAPGNHPHLASEVAKAPTIESFFQAEFREKAPMQ